MRTAVIVQARMSSHRLPGKVMRLLGGKPVIEYLLERLSICASEPEIVVATSTDTTDDVIADYCASKGQTCSRGDLDDVLSRFATAVASLDVDAFVRVSADSPLLDPHLVDRGLELFARERPFMATNVLRRTYPRGQSVEVLDAEGFLSVVERISAREDREHVTPWFYRHQQQFSLAGFEASEDLSRFHLAVDTEVDAARIEELISKMSRDHRGYDVYELCELLDEDPGVAKSRIV